MTSSFSFGLFFYELFPSSNFIRRHGFVANKEGKKLEELMYDVTQFVVSAEL